MTSLLSFNGGVVKQGLQRIAKEIGPDIGLDEVHRKIWAETYSRRIVNICHTSVVRSADPSGQSGPQISWTL